ncbi:MAG: toll/interleukin-1 receptor domain-containing protein [Actinomycetota bacterium]|nr:toll/interleukin-1 receptor domain-containing protein [Actinomycetota bacterium]
MGTELGRGRHPRSALRIFLSYRRDDASGHAGRLYDALASEFGESNVFMDIDTIEFGVDFAEVVQEGVGSCDALIALIGRQWLTATDSQGRRRLDDPNDFVRLELETALERGVPVIPARVQGGEHPRADELPDSLTRLSTRQGLELHDIGWHDDVRRLVARLKRLGEEKPEQPRPARGLTAMPRRPSRRVLLAAAVLVALAAAAIAVALISRSGGKADKNASFPTAAERRLLGFIPPVVRATCKRAAARDASASASVDCSAARTSLTYRMFGGADVLAAWYAQWREEAQQTPGSGSCTPTSFSGEKPYGQLPAARGRVLCFVDTDREPNLIWTDDRVPVGGHALVYDGQQKEASILRQWHCCLKVQP